MLIPARPIHQLHPWIHKLPNRLITIFPPTLPNLLTLLPKLPALEPAPRLLAQLPARLAQLLKSHIPSPARPAALQYQQHTLLGPVVLGPVVHAFWVVGQMALLERQRRGQGEGALVCVAELVEVVAVAGRVEGCLFAEGEDVVFGGVGVAAREVLECEAGAAVFGADGGVGVEVAVGYLHCGGVGGLICLLVDCGMLRWDVFACGVAMMRKGNGEMERRKSECVYM